MTQEEVGRKMEMLAEWPCFAILSDPGHPGKETRELGALFKDSFAGCLDMRIVSRHSD